MKMKGCDQMKKVVFLFLILMMLSSFAAVSADDLEDVREAGEIRFGIAPEYLPFIYHDPKGELTGIDVALMEELGRRMGVSVKLVDMAFDGLMDSLDIGQVDIIGGALSKTGSRMERIDFTRVYYKGDARFVGSADLKKPETVDLSSFRDYKIGVQKGTSFDQWIKTNLVGAGYVSARNVYTYTNVTDAMNALDRRNVDLVLLDQDVYENIFSILHIFIPITIPAVWAIV